MNKDEALRLALEALEYPGPSWLEARQPAITAIKQALEETPRVSPEPEPAIYPDEAYELGLERIAYYTSPPKREPLTDEQIEALRRSDDLFEDAPMWRLIARAIEAAHGIKGAQHG